MQSIVYAQHVTRKSGILQFQIQMAEKRKKAGKFRKNQEGWQLWNHVHVLQLVRIRSHLKLIIVNFILLQIQTGCKTLCMLFALKRL